MPAESKKDNPFNPKEFLGLKDLWAPPTKTQLDEWHKTFADKLIQMEITQRPKLVTLAGMVEMGGDAEVASAKEKLEGLTKGELFQVAFLLFEAAQDEALSKKEMIEKILPMVMLPLPVGEVWLRRPGSLEADQFFDISISPGRGKASACKALLLSCLLHPQGDVFLKQMNEPGYYDSMLFLSNPLLKHLGVGEMDIGARVKNG